MGETTSTRKKSAVLSSSSERRVYRIPKLMDAWLPPGRPTDPDKSQATQRGGRSQIALCRTTDYRRKTGEHAPPMRPKTCIFCGRLNKETVFGASLLLAVSLAFTASVLLPSGSMNETMALPSGRISSARSARSGRALLAFMSLSSAAWSSDSLPLNTSATYFATNSVSSASLPNLRT